MSDKRYYLSNFTKEQLAEMCAAEDARTDGQVHLAFVLQAENTKLRELCASVFRLANNACLGLKIRCGDCPMGKGEPQCDLVRDFIAMRKLGIDVTPWEVESVGGDNV